MHDQYPVPLLGARNTLMWAHEHEVEPQALQQLRNIAKLPWVHGVRVMPDVHLGKGATVGSVIAMKDAVSPNAVGVDIGCVDGSTEYLSPDGWRRIDEYDGGKVMQYDPADGTGRFVDPLHYVVKDADVMLHFKTKYGIDQMLTPDHKVLAWKITGRNRNRELVVLSAAELAATHDRLVQGAKYEFQTTFAPVLDTKVDFSDDQIRLQVAVNADSHKPVDERKVWIRLVKERKIERLRHLLFSTQTDFSERVDGDGVHNFKFVSPTGEKGFGPFWASSPEQLQVIADEVLLWDGNSEDRVFFSRKKDEADFIQYVFSGTGSRAVMRDDVHKSDGKTDYRVFANTNTMVGLAGVPKSPVTEVPSVDGKAYCFTLPSGFWVMRRGGNVVMTGNCGMLGVKTSLTAADLPDDLGTLRAHIEETIPVGFNGHDSALNLARVRPVGGSNAAFLSGTSAFWDRFSGLHEGVQKIEGRARQQLGTLGGGNHFIEICLDEDDVVWLQLHSGSRNIGKELAERHISVAKGLDHNLTLPDRDLAVFLAGTREMKAYLNDLTWAQEFAARSRAVMMALLVNVMREWFPDATYEQVANVHHNYVAVETIDDTELIVTRKGAIRAGAGDIGLIPGSMGTGSYIVRGIGSTESYQSASHGAGRKMSRSAAKRNFTVDDLVEQTAGVECRKDAGVVDEIPGAYKDLESVIAAQVDLVDVVARLRTILCVKG